MVWLRCEVQKGMLGQEYAVQIDTTAGKASLFVAPSKLNNVNNGRGLLLVELIDRNAEYGLVQLPTSSIEGARIVRVDASELTLT